MVKAPTLEDVYRAHMPDLYRYLLRLSGHPQTAEDLVQDTFIKAYEQLDGYGGEQVRPWLFRVARNAYIDWYRRRRRQVQADPESLQALDAGPVSSPEAQCLVREQLDAWFAALNTLSENGRQAVLLRDYHGFSYQEIAQVMGLSQTNVKVTLFRARQKLKEVLHNEL